MAGRSGPRRALTFAMVAPAGAAQVHLQTLCGEMSAKRDWFVLPHLAPSYDALVESVRSARVHLAWAPPLVALRIEDAAAGSAVLRPARNALAEYHAALFVRSDSQIHAVPQLAGSRVAWVDPTSSAGYVVPRLHLRASGVDPDAFFGDQRFLRNHARVARAVLRGEVDAGATYATSRPGDAAIVEAGWTRIGARNDEVRVLALAGPIPSDVIVIAHVPREIAAEITTSLEHLRSPTVRSLFGADQLEHVPSRHFEPLRRLLAAAPAKPAHVR